MRNLYGCRYFALVLALAVGCVGADGKDSGGYGLEIGGDTAVPEDADGDGSPDESDCDALDPAVFPGAEEICDGLDNDCDGAVDDVVGGDIPSWYRDADGDGYGDSHVNSYACDAPEGYVVRGGDCDEADAAVNPGADEACDELDNDCDGETDEGYVKSVWYADADDDRYGSPDDSISSCADTAPSGYVANATDCDDGDKWTHPGMVEICDELDNDCDGETDEDATDAAWWFPYDADGDGWGQNMAGAVSCTAVPPAGTSEFSGDCDDVDSAVNPDARDVCDGLDNDCDGAVDDWEPTPLPLGGTDAPYVIYYYDADGDGWGGFDIPSVCEYVVRAEVTDVSGDCDDAQEDANPGEVEVCGDGLDNDCDLFADDEDFEGCREPR